MQITYGLRRCAQIYGDRIAMQDSDGTWTWKETAERISRVAGGLRANGIGPDDRVAILMLNGHRYFELMYATIWAGGVIVPLNTRHAAPEVIFQMIDCETKMLVIDDAFVPMLEKLEGQIPSLEKVVYAGTGKAPAGMTSFEDMLQSDPLPDAGRDGSDLMGIFYTGGTTGRSKGVMLSHDNAVLNAANALICLDYDKDSNYLHVAPMFHLADAGTTWTITLAGGTHSFIPGFDPEKTLQAISHYKVNKVILVPTMINMVINHPSVGKHDTSTLQTVLYGASPIPLAVLKKAIAILGCDFAQGYGMTESSQLVTVLPPEDHLHPEDHAFSQRLKSAGHAYPLTELEIRDENDKPLPANEVGEVCFKGPNVMQGYLNMPEATAEAIRDGWMHSGDVGYLDEHGYLYLVDRSKDMIVSGGENVYSTEVETAIYAHPAVLEAAAIGIPHEEWGEAVHAVVALKHDQSATEAEIIAHCKELIAGYKCPKSISFHDGELPKSGPGKILKRELRKPFWGDSERNIN